jgi:hypothetical protein
VWSCRRDVAQYKFTIVHYIKILSDETSRKYEPKHSVDYRTAGYGQGELPTGDQSLTSESGIGEIFRLFPVPIKRKYFTYTRSMTQREI